MMTDEQAAALTPEQIAALPVIEVQDLTVAQIVALSTVQFGALWESHAGDLTEAQKAARAEPLEPKHEAWIATGLKRISDAVTAAPSHLELPAAFEAFMRHLVTYDPGDDPPVDEATETASANLADLESDPEKYRAAMGDGPYEAEVARLKTLVPVPGAYETINYADGSSASGPGPLPRLSPEEQVAARPIVAPPLSPSPSPPDDPAHDAT